MHTKQCPCTHTHTRTHTHSAQSRTSVWRIWRIWKHIWALLKPPHPDIHFWAPTCTHTHTHTHAHTPQIRSWPWRLPTGPLDSHADDIISSQHAGKEAGMEGGRGGFTALLETVWGGELSWKQRAMDEWSRMTDGEGKEHTHKHLPTHTHTHTYTQTDTHAASHVFLLNSWGKISLSCNDF